MSERFSAAALAELFADVGRELTHLADTDDVLTLLARRAVDLVPGAERAGITRGSKPGGFSTVAATDDVVNRIDRLQYELHSGPCVDAITESTVFRADDLRTDVRWPVFGRRAFDETATISMLSFRLFVEDDADIIAGLNMYSSRRAAFDEDSQAVGLLLATHGALAISAVAAHQQATNLGLALHNSREIGVAMGVLMSQRKITRDAAFDLLRIASQHAHRKLADVAAEVAETGSLPLISEHR